MQSRGNKKGYSLKYPNLKNKKLLRFEHCSSRIRNAEIKT